MQRGNPRVWTAHNSKACFQGEKLQIVHNGEIVAQTVFKPEAAQPRAYFECKGNIEVKSDGTVVIKC